MRIVWADKGRRTLKYHQLLSEVLELNDAEKALVTVLLLRGAQAPGELRTRTDRLHGFADRGEVEVVLADLAARPEPLVRELPRQRGQHDTRWVHLLGDVAGGGRRRRRGRAGGGPRVGARRRRRRPATSGCGRRTTRSRRRTPTTWPTSCSAAAVRDAGCSTGSPRTPTAARWSRSAAAPATSRRTSPRPAPTRSASTSRRAWSRRRGGRFPDGDYQVGDLRRLMRPTSAPGWSAVLAWYSLIHLAASELPDALAALDPAAAPGRLARRRPARRRRGPPQRRAGSTCRSTSTSSSTTRPRWCALVEAAGLTDVEWYHRGPITARGETTRAALRRRPEARLTMRVLFSSTSGYGHVIPMLPLARAFREAGHDVLWATAAQAMPLVIAAGVDAVAPGASGPEEAALRGAVLARAEEVAGAERAAFVFPRMFGEALTPPMAKDLLDIARDWAPRPARPRARRARCAAGRGRPRCPERHPLVRHRGAGGDPRRDRRAAWPGCGRSTASRCRRTPAASGPATSTSARRRCRSDAGGPHPGRPAAAARRATVPGGGPRRGPARLRHPGHRPAASRLLREVVAGVAALPVRVLVAVGPRMDPASLGEQPAHVQVEAWVDQAEVLARCTAVVSHGGSGTFLGALARGVPQLCLPQAADQFRNAEGGIRAGRRRWPWGPPRRPRPRCGPRSSGCCRTRTSGRVPSGWPPRSRRCPPPTRWSS